MSLHVAGAVRFEVATWSPCVFFDWCTFFRQPTFRSSALMCWMKQWYVTLSINSRILPAHVSYPRSYYLLFITKIRAIWGVAGRCEPMKTLIFRPQITFIGKKIWVLSDSWSECSSSNSGCSHTKNSRRSSSLGKKFVLKWLNNSRNAGWFYYILEFDKFSLGSFSAAHPIGSKGRRSEFSRAECAIE